MVSMLLPLVDYSPIVMMTQCAIYPIVHFGDYLLATSLKLFNNIKLSFFASHMKSSFFHYVGLIYAVRLLDALDVAAVRLYYSGANIFLSFSDWKSSLLKK